MWLVSTVLDSVDLEQFHPCGEFCLTAPLCAPISLGSRGAGESSFHLANLVTQYRFDSN